MANTPRARALGRELRKRREAAGLTLEATAEKAQWSLAKVGRLERADQGISEGDVATLLFALGVSGEDREQLLKLTRELDQPAWWEGQRGLPNVTSALIDAESRAERIVDLSTLVVPGLLQTRMYSEALFRASGIRDVSSAASARQLRQGILTQDDPVSFTALIDESVLQRPVGSHSIAAVQLRHVEHMASTCENVSVYVIPTSVGAHPGMDGPYAVLHLPAATYVHAEAGNAGFLIDDETDVRPFVDTIDRVRTYTLSSEPSLKTVAAYADEHERKANE
ncbi:transcriptional regulator with XRE-family HTH domain [Actinopolyspora lacussalsi]|nr:transcriptional regulator with XRE-family HTH domain [Actinopolyspora lacussalsi]